jgi:hypothetical protein
VGASRAKSGPDRTYGAQLKGSGGGVPTCCNVVAMVICPTVASGLHRPMTVEEVLLVAVLLPPTVFLLVRLGGYRL